MRERFLFKAPRGTVDILPEEQSLWAYVQETASTLCDRFGYGRIDTPEFETSSLFHRSVGSATDVVEKETYTFEDRSGDSITLRPEGTASVCRAYLQHGMQVQPQPVRLYSVRAPMFRYDRPQAGRLRQHHQISVEAIGSGEATIDAEIVELAWRLLTNMGLEGLSLRVNSIGDSACRPLYIQHLTKHYQPHVSDLCPDCQRRFESNTLRLLDCKKATCQSYTEEAPKSVDYLCDACQLHWNHLVEYLTNIDIPFTVDHRLVRGFDYYTRTVFEIQPPGEGAQNSLAGGGRYDGLIEQLGGRQTPGIGFASGMERLILNLKRQGLKLPATNAEQTAIVISIGSEALPSAVKLASDLRAEGLKATLAPAERSLKAQLRYADSLEASHVLIIGEEELRENMVTLKGMVDGSQRRLPSASLIEAIKSTNS